MYTKLYYKLKMRKHNNMSVESYEILISPRHRFLQKHHFLQEAEVSSN